LNGIQEVSGSIPLSSTIYQYVFRGGPDRFFLKASLCRQRELAFFSPQRLFFASGAMANPNTPNPPPEQAGKPVTDEAILKVAKEVVVKFIEVGRLSPANFCETFQEIYQAVRSAVRS
jgi:hypothetical protein